MRRPSLEPYGDSSGDTTFEDDKEHDEDACHHVLLDDERPLLPSRAWAPISSFEHAFIPSLEGIRGVAVTLTMMCHAIQPRNFRETAGSMGVTVFFVLSGFLITGVLLRQQAANPSDRGVSYRHLPRFYADRFVRLGPALFAVILFGWAARRSTGEDMAAVNRYALLGLFYLSNFKSLQLPTHGLGFWPNLWSLACEEQFYILWAFALPLLCKLTYRLRVTLLALTIAVSVFVRVWVSMYRDDDNALGLSYHFSLLPNVYKMLAGASLRLVRLPPWLSGRRCAYLGLLGLVFVLAVASREQPNLGSVAPGWKSSVVVLRTWGDLVSVVSTVLIITGAHGVNGGCGLLEGRSVRFVGKVSYAWYLWQVPLLKVYGWRRTHWAVAETALAFMVAMASTFWLEEPIMKAYKRTKEKRKAAHLGMPM